MDLVADISCSPSLKIGHAEAIARVPANPDEHSKLRDEVRQDQARRHLLQVQLPEVSQPKVGTPRLFDLVAIAVVEIGMNRNFVSQRHGHTGNYLGVAARSFPYTVTIDKQATLLNADSQLIFPPEVSPPPKEIDAFYLARPENQDRVLARLPVYSEPKVGDVITWYWEEFPDSVNEVDTLTLELATTAQAVPCRDEFVFRNSYLLARRN
jgi:hypothetical protein